MSIRNYDPNAPISVSNPSINSISVAATGDPAGLALSENINGVGPSPTFYIVDIFSEIWYYDGATWVNTGHSMGATNQVNLGAGGGYIYSFNCSGGSVYRYDGTGNGTLVLTISPWGNSGICDVAVDCEGNFYVMRTVGSQWVRKYDPSGNLLKEWVVTGIPQTTGGGLAVIGDKIYFDQNNSSAIYSGIIAGDTINASFVSFISPKPADMATCPFGGAGQGSRDTVTVCGSGISVPLQVTGSGPFNWDLLAGSASISATGPQAIVIPSTNATITATYQGGCVSVTDTFDIQLLTIGDTVSASICEGTSYTFGSQELSVPGMYIQSFATVSGCDSVVVLYLSVSPGVSAPPIDLITACAGESQQVILPELPDAILNWETGDATLTGSNGNYSLIWNDAGVYTYSLNIQHSCGDVTITDTVVVGEAPVADIMATDPLVFCFGESITVQATAVPHASYKWYNPAIIPYAGSDTLRFKPQPGELTLVVSDSIGCSARDSIMLVDNSCCMAEVPSAFSPNGDNRNDMLKVLGQGIYRLHSFRIFNRFGQAVYTAHKLNEGWDGTFLGKPADIGTYFYMLEYQCRPGDEVMLRKGDVTLIR